MKIKQIYIDESGHPKNTITFIICFVIFENKADQDLVNENINEFKHKRFNTSCHELHFNRESLSTKIAFFRRITFSNFTIRYYNGDMENNNWSNEEYIIKSIENNKDIIDNSVIYIDGAMSKKYNRLIISKIKTRLRAKSIYPKSIQYTDSKNNNLIQLADMCAGCIRRKIERNTVDDQKLYNIIKHRVTNPK